MRLIPTLREHMIEAIQRLCDTLGCWAGKASTSESEQIALHRLEAKLARIRNDVQKNRAAKPGEHRPPMQLKRVLDPNRPFIGLPQNIERFKTRRH